jgi:hypothetical protein
VHLAGNTGQGIKIAIIDTGIDYIHNDPDDLPYVVDPEFNHVYKGGYDFYNNDADPYDDNGHGTHVAGILSAEHNGYLVVGVAPSVDLYALKVLSAAGEGDYSGLIAALGWAVDHDIDVVNMSLGGHEASAALQTAVANAYNAGVTLVAASGNVNPNNINELLYGCPVAYPAAYDQVIAVSFTNTADKLTGFSCTGTQVDMAAPGDQIFSPVPAGPTGSCMFCSPYGYSAQSGTSMASPHMAGVVVKNMLVHFIGDGDDVMLQAQLGDGPQLVAREDFAGGIMRRVDDNRPGPRVECRGQFVGIEVPAVAAQRHIARRHAGHDQVRHIGVVNRLENDHLIARIGQTENRRKHRFGGARGYQHVGVRVQLLVVEALGMVRDRPAHRRHADARRILIERAIDSFDRRRQHFRRPVEIRRALAEIDRAMLGRQSVNVGKYRRAETGDPLGHC